MELCSVGVMGTKYVRDQTLSETIEIFKDKIHELTIPNIYSEISIGNLLDINLRQASGNELSFVTLSELNDYTLVIIDTNGLQDNEYKLVLESFDKNS